MSESTPRSNRFRRVSFGLAGAMGLVAVVMAGAVVWLVLTDPVTVAEAVDTGEYAPLVDELADVIYKALIGLISYL